MTKTTATSANAKSLRQARGSDEACARSPKTTADCLTKSLATLRNSPPTTTTTNT